jgi:hypothetical protein
VDFESVPTQESYQPEETVTINAREVMVLKAAHE